MDTSTQALNVLPGRRENQRSGGFMIRHAGDCNGQVMVSGTIRYQPVVGFGFVGNRFVVDRARGPKGWLGICLKCGAEGAFFTGKLPVTETAPAAPGNGDGDGDGAEQPAADDPRQRYEQARRRVRAGLRRGR